MFRYCSQHVKRRRALGWKWQNVSTIPSCVRSESSHAVQAVPDPLATWGALSAKISTFSSDHGGSLTPAT